MIKRVLLAVVMLLATAYWGVAVTLFNRKPTNEVCQRLEVIQTDTLHAGYVTFDDVATLLRKHSMYPIGRKMNEINTDLLEKHLADYPLIEKAECYKSLGGTLCVQVMQRIPILHVINDKGEDFYLDDKGKVMPTGIGCVAHLPVVTGSADKAYVEKVMHPFGVFIRQNPFWDAQIEQIHVSPSYEVELVPRVGNHIVFLGKLDSFEEKLESLKIFYEKALSQVGWNKYSRISVEFTNQIICTKKN